MNEKIALVVKLLEEDFDLLLPEPDAQSITVNRSRVLDRFFQMLSFELDECALFNSQSERRDHGRNEVP